MPIIFRYLFREYAKIFSMCFAGLMTIYLVIDFFEKVRRFLSYDARWVDVLSYFALKIPGISFQIIPLAVLMSMTRQPDSASCLASPEFSRAGLASMGASSPATIMTGAGGPGLPFYAQLLAIPAAINIATVTGQVDAAWQQRLQETDARFPPTVRSTYGGTMLSSRSFATS